LALATTTELTAAETNDVLDVTAEIRGPTRVRYEPALLGVTRPIMRITVRNRGSAPVDVQNLRARLVATRDGTPFRCAHEIGPPERSPETQVLSAGTSAVFERALDCALPLAGKYSVRVVVAFGHAAPWSEGAAVQTLELNVVAPANREPVPIQSIPGLWAAVGAGGVVSATSKDASGKLAIALVNGGATTIEIPPLRLALRVYRAGLSVPCEDEPIKLQTPASMAPGRTHVEVLQVSCLGLAKPGRYEVAARLLVAGGSAESELELGRFRVEVSSDPARLDPARGVPWAR
jgi:hypothetical protein